MTDKNLTEIICIVDRSGSMEGIREDAIGGFNTFLKEQQDIKSDRCILTYAQFDDRYEVVHNGKPIGDVPPLTHETFVPRGSTALLDAIGRTINVVGARLSSIPDDTRPGKVIVIILTDGGENSSEEYTHSKVMEMIKTQTDEFGWVFNYLAAGPGAIGAGDALGVVNSSAFAGANRASQSYAHASSMSTRCRLGA